MGTETDNDRWTAIEIARAHTDAQDELAIIQVGSILDQAEAQAKSIREQAKLSNQSQQAIARVQAEEIFAMGEARIASIWADGDLGASEIFQVSGVNVRVASLIAQSDYLATIAGARTQAAAAKAEARYRMEADRSVSRARIDGQSRESAIDAGYVRFAAGVETAESSQDAALRSEELAQTTADDVGVLARTTTIENAAQIYGANASARSSTSIATADSDAAIRAAKIDAESSLYGANSQSAIAIADANSGARQTRSGAVQDYDSAIGVARLRSDVERHGADNQFAAALAREDGEDAKLRRMHEYAQARFNEAWAKLQQASQEARDIAAASDVPVGRRGVFTPRMVRVMTSGAIARADIESATDYRRAQGSASSRGLAAHSPFLAAYRMTLAGRVAQESAGAQVGMEIQSAQANADQILAANQARVAQAIGRGRVALAIDSNLTDLQVGLIQAAAGMGT